MAKLRRAFERWWWFLPIIVGPPILWVWADSADDIGLLSLVWMWTIGSAIGLLASAGLARQTWREYAALIDKQRNDKALTLIAEANFRREVFRIVEFLSLLIIGTTLLLGMTNVLLNRTLIVMVVALVFGNVMLDWWERRRSHAVLIAAVRATHESHD